VKKWRSGEADERRGEVEEGALLQPRHPTEMQSGCGCVGEGELLTAALGLVGEGGQHFGRRPDWCGADWMGGGSGGGDQVGLYLES
jgi:hypothetical protein